MQIHNVNWHFVNILDINRLNSAHPKASPSHYTTILVSRHIETRLSPQQYVHGLMLQ